MLKILCILHGQVFVIILCTNVYKIQIPCCKLQRANTNVVLQFTDGCALCCKLLKNTKSNVSYSLTDVHHITHVCKYKFPPDDRSKLTSQFTVGRPPWPSG